MIDQCPYCEFPLELEPSYYIDHLPRVICTNVNSDHYFVWRYGEQSKFNGFILQVKRIGCVHSDHYYFMPEQQMFDYGVNYSLRNARGAYSAVVEEQKKVSWTSITEWIDEIKLIQAGELFT